MIDYSAVIKEETKKCILDPSYFIKGYCKIEHPMRGLIPFDLYDYQNNVIIDYQKYRFNIVLKSRQLGITTTTAAYCFWLLFFNKNKKIQVLATKQKVATNIVNMMKVMYTNLPTWLKKTRKPVRDGWNSLSIKFDNGSEIFAQSTTEEAGRSAANSLVVIDEDAFIPRMDKIWPAIEQTLATGGACIRLSTPNGQANHFYETWNKSILRENEFHRIKLRWDVHPERNQSWRNEQDKILGPKLATQECDADFLSSGANVINPLLIKQYEETFIRNPILKKGPGENLWIWELPIPGQEYIVAADVARGDGSDYSACHVISKDNVEQIAEFKMQIGTREFAQLLFNLGIEYNNALLVVENASMGWDVIQELINLGYPNLYYSNPALLFTSTNNNFIPFDGTAKLVPGFTNSSKTRPMIIAKLETYFNEQACIFHSERLLSELNVFIWYKGKAQAQPGFNDDLVIPWATGLFIRDTFSKLYHHGLQLTEALVDSIGTSISSGVHERERNKIIQENFTMSDGKQGVESLDWLLDNNTKIKVDNPVEKKQDNYSDRLIWIG